MYRDPPTTARAGREPAAARHRAVRDLVVETGNRRNVAGSPETVARTLVLTPAPRSR